MRKIVGADCILYLPEQKNRGKTNNKYSTSRRADNTDKESVCFQLKQLESDKSLQRKRFYSLATLSRPIFSRVYFNGNLVTLMEISQDTNRIFLLEVVVFQFDHSDVRSHRRVTASTY